LVITAYFDNSLKNAQNPDPSKAIRWGEPESANCCQKPKCPAQWSREMATMGS